MLANKQLKAFTLAEMLVVLVISSIVITITILVLNLVQGQIKSIQNIYKENTEVRLLERVLLQDFNKYTVSYNDSSQALFCISDKDSVNYTFYNEYIVRNNDTIKATVIQKKMFLDGEEVSNGVVDAIEIQLSKEIKNKKLFIFKRKDATHYMNE